jgi:hypothetical protein
MYKLKKKIRYSLLKNFLTFMAFQTHNDLTHCFVLGQSDQLDAFNLINAFNLKSIFNF